MTSLEGSVRLFRRLLMNALRSKDFGGSLVGLRAGIGRKFGRKSALPENHVGQWSLVLASATAVGFALVPLPGR